MRFESLSNLSYILHPQPTVSLWQEKYIQVIFPLKTSKNVPSFKTRVLWLVMSTHSGFYIPVLSSSPTSFLWHSASATCACFLSLLQTNRAHSHSRAFAVTILSGILISFLIPLLQSCFCSNVISSERYFLPIILKIVLVSYFIMISLFISF